MKILFLVRNLARAGAQRQLAVLARGLAERGHAVSVAVFYPGEPLEANLRQAGIPIHSLEKSGRWDLIAFAWRLVGLLRRERPDVVHGYMGVPNALTIALKPLFPGIRMVWGVRSTSRDLSQYEWLIRLEVHLNRRLAAWPDLIIANSFAGAEHHRSVGYPASKMVVVPNGIDTERFRPVEDERSRLRAELGVPAEGILFGIAATLTPVKDHRNFLRAAAVLAERREDVHFACVGGGDSAYAEQLRELARQLGIAERVTWTGPRDNMRRIFGALDVLVSSSEGEGFSNAIAEAMACEVPCVATDVGDSAHIVGDTGAVVPAHDFEQLAGAMGELAELAPQARRALGRRARDRIRAEFSIDSLADSTEEQLEALLGGGRAG